MSKSFEQVQRIVLHGSVWAVARHLVISFPQQSAPLRFLAKLRPTRWPTGACAHRSDVPVQVSLGFSRRGLERMRVPEHILTRFALKAPAFSAGAALRASSHLGASGSNVPGSWDSAFRFTTLDAVLSLHAMNDGLIEAAVDAVKKAALDTKVQITKELVARSLPSPLAGATPDPSRPPPQWVHFGYRDGLARIGIEDWTEPNKLKECKATSRHQAGEFLLGHAQDSGANPWIAGPGSSVWPKESRAFFRDGSFGVLHQIEQYVETFERFVTEQAEPLGMTSDELKATLCGRFPNGRPLVAAEGANPCADFDYKDDHKGHRCPFGSHVRRMNPRADPAAPPLADALAHAGRPQAPLRCGTPPDPAAPPTDDALAHAGRSRALLRRGLPYGAALWSNAQPDAEGRGLMGHFFCASLEDQFEHLIGQWAERVPLGSADQGQARDPLIGAHEPGDGAFDIPRKLPLASQSLKDLPPFTRTRGIAYLFYPSLRALEGIAKNNLWLPEREDDE